MPAAASSALRHGSFSLPTSCLRSIAAIRFSPGKLPLFAAEHYVLRGSIVQQMRGACMADLPEGFDLEALLAPIQGDAPQGSDIRDDISAMSPYNRLRDARSEARDAERGQDRGEADARDPTPLWRAVRELAMQILAENTKDL